MPDVHVSVILGVRDGEKYLRDALDSIANQNFQDMEVIVVDDGSTDGSVAIAARHPLSPRVLSQEPSGVGAALNHGIRMARGRYLAFLDCDDIWPSGRLRVMLAVFEHDSSIDFVYGNAVNTDEDLNAIGSPRPVRLIGALMIKQASASRVGEFRTDVTHAAIIDWVSRAERAGLKFKVLDELVLLRRIHDTNLGIIHRSTSRSDLLRVIRDHHKRMRQ